MSNPAYLKFLFNRHAHNRIFALTIFRIWIAYRVGAMRYGVFTFVKTLIATAAPTIARDLRSG